LLALVLSAFGFWISLPDVRPLAGDNPTTTAFIARARAAAGGGQVDWHWVPYDQISPSLKRAVLVAEDISFFTHGGFSFPEIKDAVDQSLKEGVRLRGASTITQQLAKNLWLSPKRSLIRKLREAAITIELEHYLGKRRILELYLNVVQFGPGVFGADAAAERYFGKTALELTDHEAAELAAGLSRPSIWNPESTSASYRERVQLVEDRMAKAEFLWRQI
jgi:monofunctional biosynthetic peptidoglycan transglycosylase